MSMILVTGGAGYIGSHACIALMAAGHDVIVVDNLCNGNAEALPRVERLAGRPLKGFYPVDLRDKAALGQVFKAHPIDAVMHFAALKSVAESLARPLVYYDNNVSGTLNLLQVMANAKVRRLVFSSSATVYGQAEEMPVDERAPTQPYQPYGWSKLMMERVLADAIAADEGWHIAILRYFNPVGAHPSGLVGEDPRGMPNNLLPLVGQVAMQQRDHLHIFGSDYPTADGTGVRDYIHVVDLVEAHVRTLECLDTLPRNVCLNLGTGRGYSVLEIIDAYQSASGMRIPFVLAPRRPGDIAECWANPSLASRLLGWRAGRGILDMCRDAWNWQNAHPFGYAS